MAPLVISYAGFLQFNPPASLTGNDGLLVLTSKNWSQAKDVKQRCYVNLVVLFRALLWFSDPVINFRHNTYQAAANSCNLGKSAAQLSVIASSWCRRRRPLAEQDLSGVEPREKLLAQLVDVWLTRTHRWTRKQTSFTLSEENKALLARESEAFRSRDIGWHMNFTLSLERSALTAQKRKRSTTHDQGRPSKRARKSIHRGNVPSPPVVKRERSSEDDDTSDSSSDNDSSRDSSSDSSDSDNNNQSGNANDSDSTEGDSSNSSENANDSDDDSDSSDSDGINQNECPNGNANNNDVESEDESPSPKKTGAPLTHLRRIHELRRDYARQMTPQLSEAQKETVLEKFEHRLAKILGKMEVLVSTNTGSQQQRDPVEEEPTPSEALADALNTAESLRGERDTAREETAAKQVALEQTRHELTAMREERDKAVGRGNQYRDTVDIALKKATDAGVELESVRTDLTQQRDENDSLKQLLEAGRGELESLKEKLEEEKQRSDTLKALAGKNVLAQQNRNAAGGNDIIHQGARESEEPPFVVKIEEPAFEVIGTAAHVGSELERVRKELREAEARIKDLLEQVCDFRIEKAIAAQVREREVAKHQAALEVLQGQKAELERRLAALQGA